VALAIDAAVCAARAIAWFAARRGGNGGQGACRLAARVVGAARHACGAIRGVVAGVRRTCVGRVRIRTSVTGAATADAIPASVVRIDGAAAEGRDA
jgi:hypothetical protein